jgi:5-methyltetrahydropteroyltriglutamate--homocysteine methyltransferase
MVIAANLGFPRIGADRELKKALESYWKGEISADILKEQAKALRANHWQRQSNAGIAQIPSGDFSFYDITLDHIHMFGAIPERYNALKNADALTLYFAMARGHQKDGVDVVAMEMTKWFDTNYHYIVPEFSDETEFALTMQLMHSPKPKHTASMHALCCLGRLPSCCLVKCAKVAMRLACCQNFCQSISNCLPA